MKLQFVGKAELMYKVAMDVSIRNAEKETEQKPKPNLELEMKQKSGKKTDSTTARAEAAAICNYATFLYRQRKNAVQARDLFVRGLRKYPSHKGLLKNFLALLKANGDILSIPSEDDVPSGRNSAIGNVDLATEFGTLLERSKRGKSR